MKKTLVSAITTALVVGAASTTFAAANPFSDVPADSWAYDAVTKLAKDGVINGYGDGSFRGDNTITRYEMAQIVAKAMAKTDVSASDKATIDKLAAEFADELNNLGVRVDNLEKKVDNLKWTGFARYNYIGSKDDTNGGNRVNTNAAILRLNLSAQINDNWTANSRLEYNTNVDDETTKGESGTFNRVWAEGNIGAAHTKLGKFETTTAQGVVMDDTISGAEVSFGKTVKTTLTYGRYGNYNGDYNLLVPNSAKVNTVAKDESTVNYSAVQFDYAATPKLALTAGYYQFGASTGLAVAKANNTDSDKVWGLGGTYKFSDTLAADAYYAKSNLDVDNTDAQKAYNFELRYKGADAAAAGSFGAWIAYRYVGDAASFVPTWDAVSADNKGIEIGGNYTFDKNVLLTARYFKGTRVEDTNKDVSKIFTTLDFLF